MGVIYNRYMVDRQTKEDRKLINNVKLHPALYDATHVSYNNRFERKRIWELISQSLDSTAKICEDRWNDLVEIYKSNVFTQHRDLFQIMNQFLNINHESTDLSAEESVEQIDNEEILIFNLTPADKTFASLPSDIRSFVNSKRRGRFRCSNSLCAADPVEFFSI